MPQLLLEFFSEEIPARMQKRAEEDLARALGEKLKGAGLEPKAIKTFSSPRRIGAVIDDLPAKAADVNEEKKGPRVGSPDQAIQGFLKSAGLASIDQAQIVEDKKGAFYVAKIERAGRETSAIVQEIVPEIVRAFPWPKSMRSQSSDLQWVRPLHNICCIFDGKPVKISIDGVGSEGVTWGHRFHAPEAMPVSSASDHASKLRGAKVLIERDERKQIILDQAKKLCAAKGLELVEDIGLLEEVAGLVEWPVTLLGDMDPAFLDLPGEVIRLSMRTHQKYFAVRDPKSGKLAPHFITVANVEAKDGGKAIAAGNARVLSARLNDARFFWDTDKKTPLYTEERKAKLEKIVFHQKLGSVWDKVERVKALAAELCAVTGADVEQVKRAAELCKMDLVTETVGEFPELQGQVGRQLYAATENALVVAADKALGAEGRGSVAAAIEDHYRPLGPNDRVPEDKVAITLALADKLDTLVGFWAIDEKPTGSSDPFALRRAALGVVRIILENGVRLHLQSYLKGTGRQHRIADIGRKILVSPSGPLPYVVGVTSSGQSANVAATSSSTMNVLGPFIDPDKRESLRISILEELRKEWGGEGPVFLLYPKGNPETLPSAAWEVPQVINEGKPVTGPSDVLELVMDELRSLMTFEGDRLKVQLRDQGKRHDLVDAVFALGDDDLVRIVARVEALDAFLKSQDGANLLAGYKRAANILAAEEKKQKWSAEDAQGDVDASKLVEPAEKALHAALDSAIPTARSAVEREDFAAAMKALSGLRAPVDAFFEGVLVNAEDASLRRNRLLLLSRLREALSQVADFSKIEG
jgi:glycyl-tRNA synthetase beta chain